MKKYPGYAAYLALLRDDIERAGEKAMSEGAPHVRLEITYGDLKEVTLALTELIKKVNEETAAPTKEDETTADTEREQTEGKKLVADSIKYNSPYEATVAGMLSPDYKERFKAEYSQTKIRYEKLKAFCNRIEAANLGAHTLNAQARIEEPKHDCPLELLRDQQRAMGQYLHCLEIRAVIEGIELGEIRG